VNGRRITDEPTLELATMVYAGGINKTVVSLLQSSGCNALGLSGADMNVLRATRRTQADVDFGFVGDVTPQSVNVKTLSLLLENNITPVLCSVTHDGDGQLLNTNADSIACALATALSSQYNVQLHYCFEKKGVLTDIADDATLIPKITKQKYAQLLEGNIISGGMMPKLETAFSAISLGVKKVVIGHSDDFIKAVNNREHAGTYLVP
jgi:acetylglutamate kinase